VAERARSNEPRTPTFSLAEARRLAVASQGFGDRPAKPTARHIKRLAEQVHAFQIDSVNVLARAHDVPAFAATPKPARRAGWQKVSRRPRT